MFLYVVTNLVNGKQYIGIAVDYERRWREHRSGHGSKLVYQAIRKYGIKNLDFKVICKGAEAYVKEMEVRAIRMLNTMAPSGYNLTEGGDTGTLGFKHSIETRKKMSETRIGKVFGPHSEATKQKIRETRAKYKRGKHPRATKIVVNGVSYACLRDVAEALNVPYSTLCAFQRGISSKVFDYPPEVEKLTINGVVYATTKEASKALGVSWTTLWTAKKKQGGSNVFDYHAKDCCGSKHFNAKRVTINGVEYGCIKDAAKSLRVNYSTLRDARRRAKSDTFTYQRGKSPKPKGGASSRASNSKTAS
jgi:group I intron endonuclease